MLVPKPDPLRRYASGSGFADAGLVLFHTDVLRTASSVVGHRATLCSHLLILALLGGLSDFGLSTCPSNTYSSRVGREDISSK